VPAAFAQFARCIEIIARDDADRQAGRQRWKHYADQGYPAQRYDVAASQGNA
jgi:DNA polymerase-3 subunit chi